MINTRLEEGANVILHSAINRHLLAGAVIGVLGDDQPEIFSLGNELPADGLFEIGSVTKVFTGFLLATLVHQNRLALNDSVCKYLPHLTVHTPANPIRLYDLATHTAGLPLLPDDVGRMRRRIDDPYSGYTFADLYKYLERISLARPAQPSYFYSNLGYVVLAMAMENATGISFPELMTKEVFEPLGLHRSFIDLPDTAKQQLLPGRTLLGRPAVRWASPVFAGCGGICSTAIDCLRFLQLCLSPPPGWSEIVRSTLEPRLTPNATPETGQIALSWKINASTGWYWHNGVTGGHSAYISFHPTQRRALVVLINRYAVSLTTHFARTFQKFMEGNPPQPLRGTYELPNAIATQAVIEFVRLPFWVRSALAAAAGGTSIAAALKGLTG